MSIPRLVGSLGLVLALASSVAAQQSPARLNGVVVDAVTSQPLNGVRVTLGASGRFVTSDSIGRFELSGIPSGITRIFFSLERYPVVSVLLAFAPGEVMVQRFELDSTPEPPSTEPAPPARPAPVLDPVTVVAEPSRGVRYADFERRLRTGRGQYVTRTQIEEGSYSRLTDALRMLRGVTIDCGGVRGCIARMTRAPLNCLPEYVIDGTVDNFFGPSVAIGDIEGIEVYTGATDVPGEFAGRNAGCGVVVIWTRAGPGRKP